MLSINDIVAKKSARKKQVLIVNELFASGTPVYNITTFEQSPVLSNKFGINGPKSVRFINGRLRLNGGATSIMA